MIGKLDSQIMAGEIYGAQLDLGALADFLVKRRPDERSH